MTWHPQTLTFSPPITADSLLTVSQTHQALVSQSLCTCCPHILECLPYSHPPIFFLAFYCKTFKLNVHIISFFRITSSPSFTTTPLCFIHFRVLLPMTS